MSMVRFKKSGVKILLCLGMVFSALSTGYSAKAEVVDGPKDAGYTDGTTEGILTITYGDTVDNGTDKVWNMQTLVPDSTFLQYDDGQGGGANAHVSSTNNTMYRVRTWFLFRSLPYYAKDYNNGTVMPDDEELVGSDDEDAVNWFVYIKSATVDGTTTYTPYFVNNYYTSLYNGNIAPLTNRTNTLKFVKENADYYFRNRDHYTLDEAVSYSNVHHNGESSLMNVDVENATKKIDSDNELYGYLLNGSGVGSRLGVNEIKFETYTNDDGKVVLYTEEDVASFDGTNYYNDKGDKVGTRTYTNCAQQELIDRNPYESTTTPYYYTYCCDKNTGSITGGLYNIWNLEDSTYYTAQEARFIRFVAMHGYWGVVDSGVGEEQAIGSMAYFKDFIKTEAEKITDADINAANGKYKDTLRNIKALVSDEGLSVDNLKIKLSNITPGEAVTITQAAIWKYGNHDKSTIPDDNCIFYGDVRENAYHWETTHNIHTEDTYKTYHHRMQTIYDFIVYLAKKADMAAGTEATVINAGTAFEDVVLNVKGRIPTSMGQRSTPTEYDYIDRGNDRYIADLTIKLGFDLSEDDLNNLQHGSETALKLVITQKIPGTRGYQVERTITLDDREDRTYTLENLVLYENADIEINVNGTHGLAKNAYLFYTGAIHKSQTLVGIASGTQHVDASRKLSFRVAYDTALSFDGTKVFESDKYGLYSLSAGMFKFLLEDSHGNKWPEEIKNAADGTISFGPFDFNSETGSALFEVSEEGTLIYGPAYRDYELTIKEDPSSPITGIVYDDTYWKVIVRTEIYTDADNITSFKSYVYSVQHFAADGSALADPVVFADGLGNITEYDASDLLSSISFMNTYEKITIDGEKIWEDADGKDGKRPETITVKLTGKANGTTVVTDSATVRADSTGKWSYEFTDLPKYYNGTVIDYVITETPVTYYETEVGTPVTTPDGYTVDIVNTELTNINGSKTWNDGNNADNKRPTSIVIHLFAGETEIDSVTVTAAQNWEWSFENLPKYKDGVAIDYHITEDPVTDYNTEIGERTETTDGYQIDVVNTEITNIFGSKTWNDGNNADRKRPTSIVIHLFAGETEIDNVTVTAAENWEWSFTGLPKYDKNNKKINYHITEDPVYGYDTEIEDTEENPDGYKIDVINTELTNINGSKTWNDGDNVDGKRPLAIVIHLFAGETEIDSVTVTEAENWEWSFTNLPKYDENNQKINYHITEDPVDEYDTEISDTEETADGYKIDVVNTKLTSINGSKTWNDGGNADNKRPTSIIIHLFAGTAEIDSVTVTEVENWEWSFTDLPKYDENNQKINYHITEDEVYDYSTAIGERNETTDGYQIDVTNTEITSIFGTKTWNDGNNADNKRPTSIVIHLFAGEAEIDSVTVTEAENWEWSFTNLPKYDENNQKIDYHIAEDPVYGYDTEIADTEETPDGYKIDVINTELTNIDGFKTWDDNENQDGKRVTSITIHLLANGTEIDSVTVTEDDNWEWAFTGLPKYDENNKKMTYTFEEDPITEYSTQYITSESDGNYIIEVINKHTTDIVNIQITKAWNDGDDQDGKRPDNVTINVLDGTTVVGTKVLSDANQWTATVTNLPKYRDGKEIVYTIEEVSVEEYETEIGEITKIDEQNYTVTVTNTHVPEPVSIKITKAWNDGDDQDGKRPDNVTINVLDGTIVVGTKVLSDSNDWTATVTNLPKYRDGKEIVYTIEEVSVEEYETEIGEITKVDDHNYTVTVTNTHETEKIGISIYKVWDDANNINGDRPESITVTITGSVKKTDGTVAKVYEKSFDITANENGDWSLKINDLDKYSGGAEIKYDVEEVFIDGYITTYECRDSEGNIIEKGTAGYEMTDGSVMIINNSKVVDTADRSNITAWFALMETSAIIALIVFIYCRKRYMYI